MSGERCPECGHAPIVHNDRVGCAFQEGTHFRCLCYFNQEMAAAPSYERALAIRRAEMLARAG